MAIKRFITLFTFIILCANICHAQLVNTVLQTVGKIDSIYSKVLNESREIYIQVPDYYNPSSSDKYPVAIILDGKVLLPTAYNVQSFYSGGYTPEMVLVGISNANNRTRDLTTSKIDEKYGLPFTEQNGEASQFIKFISDELIPFIENNYHVSKFRTLIGHSYGGLFTMYTLVHHPELFSNYIAIDPSLDWDDQKLLFEAEEKLPNNNYKYKSLFMSLSGQLHMQDAEITIDNVMQDSSDYTLFSRANITFSNLLAQNAADQLNYKWKFYPKDIHGTIPFPSIMDGLISTFEWYRMENTDKINSFETSKEELLKIINYREKKLESHFGYLVPPYPEDLLNMSGYMNMDMGKSDKAKMYFDLAIKYYPESANVYDSMADFFERNNDFVSALKFATQAYEIQESEYFKQRIQKIAAKIKE